ncbi:peptide chain release factor-like protein [Hydrogenophaga flava]|uniref:peptide chain release factor-like protein n=1 Tax=Hydrogenophaga flava TaxID=65657 RepID=UPI0009FD9C0D|nr:peptide chain release factor-like protein [Hydrogenophaga flava]
MTKAYVQAIAASSSVTSLLNEVLRECLKATPPDGELEIIDERYFSGTSVTAEYVLCVCCPDAFLVATEAVKHLVACNSNDLSITIFPLNEDSPDLDEVVEVEVSYYRDETKVDGFVHWTDGCVRLVHRPSGVDARCQAHRNRARNYAEALSFLKAKLSAHSRTKSHAV